MQHCIRVCVTNIDGFASIVREEGEQINIGTCILTVICSKECVCGIEGSGILHSKLVTRDLSGEIVASNEEITTDSCVVIGVYII